MSGYALSLSSRSAVYSVAQPIVLTVTVRNVSNETEWPAAVMPGCEFRLSTEIKATTSGGVDLSRPKQAGLCFRSGPNFHAGEITLNVGMRYSAQFVLNEFYDEQPRPGILFLRAREYLGSDPTTRLPIFLNSNEIQVVVRP